mmetsp:Transcript_27311/g.56941  ORF Transcript_27311/g.56941 Transcript_27311/m.56941 type:complete len:284 (+) Transcript_27311:15-866(+)
MPVSSSIDPVWASTLIGLPLKVPEHWWPGYKGNTLCCGRIASVSCNNNNDAAGRYFMFMTDDDKGTQYPMRYDAVKRYADKNHSSYSKFNLPKHPPKAKKRKLDNAKAVTTATTTNGKSKKKTAGQGASKLSSDPKKNKKKDISRLLKLISGDGVDVFEDLKNRLTEGDSATVELLKSIYPLNEIKKCLLCGEDCVPGSAKKCSLYHDIGFEFESDVWDFKSGGQHTGTWKGNCGRCGESFSKDGNEDDYPDEEEFGICYSGKHIFTKEGKEELLRIMNPDNC